MQSKYVIISLILLLLEIVFFLLFEKRRLKTKELVTVAVLIGIAVVSRAAFVMFPSFKPIIGIIFICGMSLGPNVGFLVGFTSALVSNFFFGQGPWTPWQMFAFGLAGLLAGILSKAELIKKDRPLVAAIVGGLIVICLVGPILDTCTLFTMISGINIDAIKLVYLSGLPINLVHGLAVFITIFLLCKPFNETFLRIKNKYGIFGDINASI